MSCINVDIKAIPPISANVTVIPSISVNATPIDNPIVCSITYKNFLAYIKDISESIRVFIKKTTKPLQVRVTTICGVNSDVVLRFDYDKLTWLDDDNREGVIKYNILTASSDWSLEEIIIEELL
jgi:hypothetical protein